MRRTMFLLFSVCAAMFVVGPRGRLAARDDGKRPPAERKPEKGKRPPAFRMFLESLSEEERAELRRLQKENPQAFREKIRDLTSKYRRKADRNKAKLKKLVAEIRNARGEERKRLVDKLSDMVGTEFDKRMENNWKNYEKAAKRLEELRKKLELRKGKRAKIISDRVEELVKDPALRW